MSEKKDEPFDQLSPEQKQCAIDITVAAAILAARLPNSAGNPTFNSWLIQEFANTYQIPPQVSRYALRHIGASLFSSEWSFSLDKTHQKLITRFRPINPAGGPDGEKESPGEGPPGEPH